MMGSGIPGPDPLSPTPCRSSLEPLVSITQGMFSIPPLFPCYYPGPCPFQILMAKACPSLSEVICSFVIFTIMVFIVLFTVIAKTQYSQKTGFISLQMPSVFKLNDSLEVIRPFILSRGKLSPEGGWLSRAACS